MTGQTVVLEAGGFSFDLVVTPRWINVLRPTATEAQRLVWHQAAGYGLDPAQVCPHLAQPSIVAVRYACRATTRRPAAEVQGLAWPSETSFEASSEGHWAELVAVANVEATPGEDFVEVLSRRLALEGPIGEEAARALAVAVGGHQGAQDGRGALDVLWGGAVVALVIWGAQEAAQLGGWTRLGVVVLTLVGLVAAIVLVGEHREATDDEREAHRRRPFSGW